MRGSICESRRSGNIMPSMPCFSIGEAKVTHHQTAGLVVKDAIHSGYATFSA